MWNHACKERTCANAFFFQDQLNEDQDEPLAIHMNKWCLKEGLYLLTFQVIATLKNLSCQCINLRNWMEIENMGLVGGEKACLIGDIWA